MPAGAASGVGVGLAHVQTVAMPRLDLPEGLTDTPVTVDDREVADRLRSASVEECLLLARSLLRLARRGQRRAAARGVAQARRAGRERLEARSRLVTAGVVCGAAEMVARGMVPVPERVARVRERCEERASVDLPGFAVDVENWVLDLAGSGRLTRG